MPSLCAGWTNDPQDPGRLSSRDPRVRSILDRIAPGEDAVDIGGAFSLNLHLTPSDRVLRIHRSFVSRRRLQAEQGLRQQLAAAGIRTPLAMLVDDRTVLVTGSGRRRRFCDVEPFIATSTPDPALDTYAWLFQQLGRLHAVLATLAPSIPRSSAATWGTPDCLRRWLGITRATISAPATPNVPAMAIIQCAEELLPAIRRQWVPPGELPRRLVHGDFRLGNAARDRTGGNLVLFDMGFAGHRPRVWDVVYALGFMDLALQSASCQHHRDVWREMLTIYEGDLGDALTPQEHTVIPAMAAIALLHTIAHAGFMAAPAAVAVDQAPFVRAAARILATQEERIQPKSVDQVDCCRCRPAFVGRQRQHRR